MYGKQFGMGRNERKGRLFKMRECHAVYIHIPFCDSICSYCDFCKMYYSKPMVDSYLQALEKEIKENYRGETIKTIYIGGGTPSCLSVLELERLFSILSIFKKDETIEFTVECNPDITLEKIELLVKYGVNRISMGVQTSQAKYLTFLNRNHSKEQVKKVVTDIQNYGIQNINIDLMYAFPNQTIADLGKDLAFFLSLNVPHISTYSLMIEPHTMLGIQKLEPIDEDIDAKMYEIIKDTLQKHGFIHYEVSNYSKEGFESKHNLTYWNNDRYYGFGLGASGYIDNIRYTNTKSLQQYQKGNYRLEEEILTDKEELENAFILGFRKVKGISTSEFQKKYHIDILKNDVVNQLLQEGKLMQKDDFIFIPEKYFYISNTILLNFLDFQEN